MADYRVVDVEQLEGDLTAVADAIRQKAGTTEPLSFPDGMAQAVAGISGGDNGAFWDIYQQNGERGDYNYSFAGEGWTDDTFCPKYAVCPITASNLFDNCRITNLKQILSDRGVRLDFSASTKLDYILQNSTITHLGEIDTTSCADLTRFLFSAKELVHVDTIRLKSDGTQTFIASLSFSGLSELEHCVFEGVIGQANFNVKWSPKLDKESLASIVRCLSESTTGLSVTVSKTAVDTAFETGVGAADGSTSTEWLALIGTRLNWTINLL